MKHISLNHGLFAIVDDEDFDRLSERSWYLTTYSYAAASIGGTTVRMHRFILGLEIGDPRIVDHVNGNILDNRRQNLRICTVAQNMMNSKLRSDNASGYKGVTWVKRWNRWQARIVISGKQKTLGSFGSPEEAHEVYCLAADMIYGEFANYGKHKAAA
jgi:hypothetical protein